MMPGLVKSCREDAHEHLLEDSKSMNGMSTPECNQMKNADMPSGP